MERKIAGIRIRNRNRIRNRIWVLLAGIMFVLSGCGAGNPLEDSGSADFTVEMESGRDYDGEESFTNECPFYVTEDIDILKLDISFQLKDGDAVLEIVDNSTGEVIWNEQWDGEIQKTQFTAVIGSVYKDREYVIRLTGVETACAKAVITSTDSSVQKYL